MLSARRAETDKVRALNLGADDYMTKPFGIEELLARINATLRRSKPAADGRPEPSVVRIGDVEIDLERRRVTKGGGLVHLTPTEFALLRQFAVSPGELLTHATLLRRVWGPGYETQTEYTRVYVGRLRAKLERDGDEPLFITEPRSGTGSPRHEAALGRPAHRERPAEPAMNSGSRPAAGTHDRARCRVP